MVRSYLNRTTQFAKHGGIWRIPLAPFKALAVLPENILDPEQLKVNATTQSEQERMRLRDDMRSCFFDGQSLSRRLRFRITIESFVYSEDPSLSMAAVRMLADLADSKFRAAVADFKASTMRTRSPFEGRRIGIVDAALLVVTLSDLQSACRLLLREGPSGLNELGISEYLTRHGVLDRTLILYQSLMRLEIDHRVDIRLAQMLKVFGIEYSRKSISYDI